MEKLTRKLSTIFGVRSKTTPEPIAEEFNDEDSDEPSNQEEARQFIENCEHLSTSHKHHKIAAALGACAENYRKAGTCAAYPMLGAVHELYNR